MASKKTKPTKEQVSGALKTLEEWFPEEAENFKKHRDDIVHHIVKGTDPKRGAPLLVQSHAKVASVPPLAVVNLFFPPWMEAIAVVVVDAFFLYMGLVGLHVSNQEGITRALLRELGEDTLRGFFRAIHNFKTAVGWKEMAKACFDILGGIYNAGGFRVAFREIIGEMSWWEWLKTGIIAIAQIVVWVATDGIAFIAAVGSTILSADQLIEDAIKAVKICSEEFLKTSA